MAAPNTKKKATINSLVLIPVQDTSEPIGQQYKYISATDLASNVSSGGGGVVTTLAEFRASDDISTTGPVVTTDYGGGTWYYVGLSDGNYVDDTATTIITANHHVWKKLPTESGGMGVKSFGAKGDGVTNDTAAFANMMTFYSLMDEKPKIYIPEGHYKINNTLVVSGGISGSVPLIEGAGGRSTILDFSGSTDTTAVFFGIAEGDTLHGGLSGVKIVGTPTMDGLTVRSYSPTSGASCKFEKIYISNCRDGLNASLNPGNTSSNYRNVFSDIHIEKYYRTGVHIQGVYSTYEDIFIVQPSGETSVATPDATKGALTMGLIVEGDDNTLVNVQTEDQISVPGRDNVFVNCSIEYIKKGQANSTIGGVALRVAGPNNLFLKFKFTGIRKAIVNQLGSMYGGNSMMMNFDYYDGFGGDAAYIPDYPIVPQVGSSGLMLNVDLQTGFHINNSAFADGIANWRMINVFGIGDKINLTLPNFLDKDTGGTVTGTTYFQDFLMLDNTSTGIFRGTVYDLAPHYIGNAAGDNYIPFITTNTPGKRVLSNIETINSGQGIFSSTVQAADGIASNHCTTKGQLDGKKAAVLTAAALPTTASATYLQSDVQKLIDRVNDLEAKLRAAPSGGLLA